MTKRSGRTRSTSPRIAPRSAGSLRALGQRMVAAVTALEAAGAAADLALYRSDGLAFDVRRLVLHARRALSEVRERIAEVNPGRGDRR